VTERVLQYFRRFGGAISLGVTLLVIGGIWAFVKIADEVGEGDSQHFDEWVLRSLRNKSDANIGIGPVWMEEVMRDFTALGSVVVLFMTVVGVLGYLLMVKKYAGVWLVIASTGGGIIVGSLMKFLFSRPRPTIVPHLAGVMTTSFPSGHSMYSAVVYLTLGALLARLVPDWHVKIYFIFVALVLIVLVGISRVYLGVHYPTDVMAGWIAGLVWALLCWLIARYLQIRGTVEKDTE
jgi:undecaprenyl-diphosphatase